MEGVRQQRVDPGIGSVVAPVLAGATLGASLSVLPSAFARPALPTVPKLALVGAVTGAGASAAAAAGAYLLDRSGDGIHGGLVVGGAGLAAVAGGRLLGRALPRDAGAIISSIGMLAAAGGGTVAATGAVREHGTSPVVSGLTTGAAAGALLLGGLGAAGALRGAPTVQAAARTTLVPTAESLAGLTPDVAKAMVNERTDVARRAYLALPGADEAGWELIGSPGRGFLRGAAPVEEIEAASGATALRAPVRLYVGAAEAPSSAERVELMLRRFDAVDGTSFGRIHVVSPDAMGGGSEMFPYAVEHGSRGNSITLMVQTMPSTPPNARALRKVGEASDGLELLLRGLKARIGALPADQRPELDLSGLCYGTLPVYALRQRLGGSLHTLGVDHTFLPVGPAASRTVRELAGQLDRGEVAGGVHVRSRRELLAAMERGDATPETLVQSSPDDPLRIGLPSLLVPFPMRPGQPYIPVLSAVSNFLDSGIDKPVAGRMLDVGHRVEASATAAANHGFGLGMTPAQMDAVDQLGIRFNAARGIAREA